MTQRKQNEASRKKDGQSAKWVLSGSLLIVFGRGKWAPIRYRVPVNMLRLRCFGAFQASQ